MAMKKELDVILTGTFKVLDSLNQKIDEEVIADGYGMRGKSRWIREAIEELLTYPNYTELISLSDEMEDCKHSISIRLPRELFLEIEKAVINIRKEFPELEGIKSRIVRTAIIQRLIRQ